MRYFNIGRALTGNAGEYGVRILPRGAAASRILRVFQIRFSFLWFAFALIGCAAFQGYPKRAMDRDAEIAQMAEDVSGAEISKCLRSPTLACRNKIIAAKMYVTDLQFSAFEETLFRGTREAAFGATLGTLGLTSAAAVVSGGASQALSGTAALVIGGREAFQKEVLSERTVVAIHTSMRGKRAQVAIRIFEGLRQPIAVYPLPLGLRDINEYYDAGTILGALVGITETVGATARAAEKDLQVTLAYKIDTGAEKLRQAICGDPVKCDKPDTTKYPAIRSCWPAAGVPSDTLMTDFIFDQKFAKARILVAQCMNL